MEILKALSKRLDKLLTIKSIVTIVLTGAFALLALKSVICGEQFLVIFTTVIAFYFGTQSEKSGSGKE